MAETVAAKDKYKALKTAVDILSYICIISLFIIPLWCAYDPAFHSHGSPGAPMPIQLKILLLDGIPTVLGVIWISFRHGEARARRWPFLRTLRFRLLVMTCAVVYGTFISILLNGK